MPHRQSVKDSDPHFTIDSASRQILNKSSKQISLIQGDHNSERFTFDLPREIEKHDMSLCNKVQIHYINIGTDGKEFADVYEPSDFGVSATDEKIVTCSWLISGNATKYAGTLNFIVRYLCINNGEIDYSWGTAIYKGIPVSDTINNSGTVVDNYSDILISWMNRVESSVSGKVSEEVNKAVEETVVGAVNKAVEDTVGVAVNKAIDEAIEKSPLNSLELANAVKGNVIGAELFLNDISPLASKVYVSAINEQQTAVPMMMSMRSSAPASEGRVNLIPFPYDFMCGENGDIVYEVNDVNSGIKLEINENGTIKGSGKAQKAVSFSLFKKQNSTYPFETGKYYTLYKYNNGGVNLYATKYKSGEASPSLWISKADGASASLTSDAVGIYIYIQIPKDTDLGEGVTIYPMIVEGKNETITEYVPPSIRAGDETPCTHIDENNDHFCDLCGERVSECIDENHDHICDICGAELSQHIDADGNGYCDTCGEITHTHSDSDNNHVCDVCGTPLSECKDDNHDHFCDICGARLSVCVDNDLDHKCDICGRVMSNHDDTDGDGYCDYCGALMHEHNDANNDHKCDICGLKLTSCVDNDFDHYCDICGDPMSNHTDSDKDHYCDYCGVEGVGEHADHNGDGICDYCGKIAPNGVTIKTASADDPDTIVETVVTVEGAIVEVASIFPAMIIKTDRDDVLLSAEYNQDTNAVIAELRGALGEGGGGAVVGDISAALDAIIVIQENLIGGGSE